jgi:hypothetical protein
VEEEFDLSEDMDDYIRNASEFTIKAATEAGMYTPREDYHYDFGKISEKDE